MGHDDEFVGLLMLLLNHLSLLDDGPTGYVYTTIFTAKQHLFIGCKDADKAQERFETNAWANRRDLMLSQTSNPTPHKS
jgi:hypothetical protein